MANACDSSELPSSVLYTGLIGGQLLAPSALVQLAYAFNYCLGLSLVSNPTIIHALLHKRLYRYTPNSRVSEGGG